MSERPITWTTPRSALYSKLSELIFNTRIMILYIACPHIAWKHSTKLSVAGNRYIGSMKVPLCANPLEVMSKLFGMGSIIVDVLFMFCRIDQRVDHRSGEIPLVPKLRRVSKRPRERSWIASKKLDQDSENKGSLRNFLCLLSHRRLVCGEAKTKGSGSGIPLDRAQSCQHHCVWS